MADIKTIKALRYTEKAGKLSDNVCPPYDIISNEERAALVENSPYNLVNLELPVGEDKYAAAGKKLAEWLDSGILARDEKEGMFVYREQFSVKSKEYVFTGLICLVKLYDFAEKVILPHEETLTKAKTDRFNLMNATFCNLSSVYSLYLDPTGIIKKILTDATSVKPEHEFIDNEGVAHRLWKIEDKNNLDMLIKAFSDKQLFIADGHHRYETALNFKKHLTEQNKLDGTTADHMMMTLVDMEDDGLVIFPTHRLITDLIINKKDLLEKVSENFEIIEFTDITKAEDILETYKDKHAFAMYDGGEGFTLLVAKPQVDEIIFEGRSKAYSSLDVTVLHSLVLEKALGIDKQNMANQINLRYTRSSEEAVLRVKKGECVLAFIINPTRIHEIKGVSLAGDKMPQKSTYFYPKLKTGLVINKLK
ncbi:MAG: hypothetical protein A2Y15_01050 [Clostridiales bacterium GWF2_36_10]|nr:MAG: hypothetical protein A2Y15_01050 [Clostridiales bacterium GWF2_36_10]HAN20553.1 DUF1015 domain-containing protein [Clostridiales bacterium]